MYAVPINLEGRCESEILYLQQCFSLHSEINVSAWVDGEAWHSS